MDEELDIREVLLAEAEECLEHGDPEGTLQSAEEVLRLDGRACEAHHLRALALRELERFPEALAAVEAALAIEASYAEAAFTRAELLTFEMGEPAQALDTCDQFLREELEDTLYADFLTLKGNALCELGDFENALACFDRANELSPEREDAGSRGWALFELGRMEEAAAALHIACQPGGSPNPANHLYLAAALTRLGDERGAASHFRIAARLDPDLYHVPRAFTEDVILEAVEEALQTLPRSLTRCLEGVPRTVKPWPELKELGHGEDRVSPLALVRIAGEEDEEEEEGDEGAHHGQGRTARHGDELVQPRALMIYERNIGCICADRETMVEELHVALWRELAHFLDLEDDEVEAHGVH